MTLNENGFQPELEMEYYEGPSLDIRRDPNHFLSLFLILCGLFVLAVAAVFFIKGVPGIFGDLL
jgi:hypothetical protein